MRYPRLKTSPEKATAYYHLMSRTVNGEFLFGEVEKEMLRRHIWLVAEFCGLVVMTYAVMSNHFHMVVRVPKKEAISDAELLRRYRLLHSDISPWQTMRLEAIERMMAENGEEAQEWRERQLALMGDISPFMRLLKQRFSIWFNRSHNRFGTLWAERYKSLLLQEGTAVMEAALYDDLNPVRAGLAHDSKDYRHCGYAQAVAGGKAAQCGIGLLFPGKEWPEVQPLYRQSLFEHAAKARAKGMVISPQELAKVVAEKGQLSVGQMLRCRAKYLTDGAVLGSKAFVAEQLAVFRERTGWGQRTRPREVPDLGDLAILRNVRRPALG